MITPHLTQQIIEFSEDPTYAHFDEYHEKMIRDAKSMLAEVIEERKFLKTLKKYLTFCADKGKEVDPSFILSHLPEVPDE